MPKMVPFSRQGDCHSLVTFEAAMADDCGPFPQVDPASRRCSNGRGRLDGRGARDRCEGSIFCAGVALAIAATTASASDGKKSEPEFRLLVLDGTTVRWGVHAEGLPTVLTYAFLTEPTSFAGARNCSKMLPPSAALEPSKIDVELVPPRGAGRVRHVARRHQHHLSRDRQHRRGRHSHRCRGRASRPRLHQRRDARQRRRRNGPHLPIADLPQSANAVENRI